MKCLAILLAAVAPLLVAAQPDCDISKLVSITASSNGKTCSQKTGFQPYQPPSGATIGKMCKVNECKALVNELDRAFPRECKVFAFKLRASVIDPVKRCPK
ncbi:hypothetical protein PINS_up016543 [Pythium insidiosum]|nr:hypothetical protein PINS_up016543 [Pythium insidiosum]